MQKYNQKRTEYTIIQKTELNYFLKKQIYWSHLSSLFYNFPEMLDILRQNLTILMETVPVKYKNDQCVRPGAFRNRKTDVVTTSR